MDNTIDAVRLALNLQELRARTASANVAGASQPGAVAQRYDFAGVENALREAVHAGDGATAARWLRTADAALRGLRPESDGAIRLDEQIADGPGPRYLALQRCVLIEPRIIAQQIERCLVFLQLGQPVFRYACALLVQRREGRLRVLLVPEKNGHENGTVPLRGAGKIRQPERC